MRTRAAADLRAVQHQVVGTRERRAGRSGERRRVIVAGRGEGVVHGDPALLIRVPLEHGELDHPQRPPARLHELQILADLQAQRGEGVVDDFRSVGAEESQVVVGGAGALENALERRIAVRSGRFRCAARCAPPAEPQGNVVCEAPTAEI